MPHEIHSNCISRANTHVIRSFYCFVRIPFCNYRIFQCLDVDAVTVAAAITTFTRRLLFVVGEEGERFHQLVALRYGQIGIVKCFTGFAIDIKPPIAFQYCLIEQRALRTQE